MSSDLRYLRAGLLISALVASACGSQNGGSIPPPTGASASTPLEAASAVTPSPSVSATPRPTSLLAAPPELHGRWRAVVGQGEVVILTIDEARYTTGGPFGPASGGVTVEGDVITFLKSTECDGMGAYRWSIEGDSLLLESIGSDDCPGRAHALAGQTYTRLD